MTNHNNWVYWGTAILECWNLHLETGLDFQMNTVIPMPSNATLTNHACSQAVYHSQAVR